MDDEKRREAVVFLLKHPAWEGFLETIRDEREQTIANLMLTSPYGDGIVVIAQLQGRLRLLDDLLDNSFLTDSLD